jgi:hypothetical protein
MLAENQFITKNEIDAHALMLLKVASSQIPDITIKEKMDILESFWIKQGGESLIPSNTTVKIISI